MFDLQLPRHISTLPISAAPIVSLRGRYCEGFRMTAHRDDAACTGAGVRNPPGKETAVRDAGGWGALWRFEREGLWDLRGLTRFLTMICGFGATEFAGLVADDGSGR
jgi:hypothetical protein